jgi:hypothetical protein
MLFGTQINPLQSVFLVYFNKLLEFEFNILIAEVNCVDVELAAFWNS